MAFKDSELAEFIKVGLNSYERAPNRMEAPHRHNEIELVYLSQGSATYLYGGSPVKIKPKTLIMFWSGVPHAVTSFSPSCILKGLEIPLAWVLQWKLPEVLSQPLLNGHLLLEADPSLSSMDGMLMGRWNKDLKSNIEELKRAVLLEVEARLWRFADSNAGPLKSEGAKHASRKQRLVLGIGGVNRVEAMAQFIAENYTRKIRVDDIAASVNLNPDYAMKIFHKAFGTRLADYIIQHRVFHAQRLLTTTDNKIMDVALESGFGSLSRFNANFKEFCGVSPKSYRNAVKIKQ
jgi:AraC-like DNA-binding protein